MRLFKNRFPNRSFKVNICVNLQVSISKQLRDINWKLVCLELNTPPDLRMLSNYSSIQSLPAFLFPHGVKENAPFFSNSYITGNPLKTSRHDQALLEYSCKNNIQLWWWSSKSWLFPFIKQVAGEQKYHSECFTCMRCEMFIGDGDSYILVEHTKLYW